MPVRTRGGAIGTWPGSDVPVDAFEVGTGRTRLTFAWQWRGSDLHVHVAGGADHLGAVALARPAADGTVSLQTACFPPHREEDIVRTIALPLSRHLGVTVCVTAGIHVDNITRVEIDAIRAGCRAGADRLCHRLRNSG
jgi:hypothetical protein